MTITIQADTRAELIAVLWGLVSIKRPTISDATRNLLYGLQKGRCADCAAHLLRDGPEKCHADHIVPLARGGSHDIRNLQLLCPPCNLQKGDLDPLDHARKRGRLF